MRMMSFMATIPQMRDQSKTVTRRMGWKFLKSGDLVLACEKVRGVKREDRREIRVIEIVSARRERLTRVGAVECCTLGWRDVHCEYVPGDCLKAGCRSLSFAGGHNTMEVRSEGFPEMAANAFIDLFCGINKCKPDVEVTRIEFQHRPDLTHCCGATRLHRRSTEFRERDRTDKWWCSDCGKEA